jgi:hypothetical protein
MSTCQTVPSMRIATPTGITTMVSQCWGSVWLGNGEVCAPHDVTRCLSAFTWECYA